jgi:hypothetical protein
MPEARTPKVEVVRVTDAAGDALAEFFRKAWGSTGNGDDVRRARAEAARTNPVAPGDDVPATAFISDGNVIGYLSSIPVRFWNGSGDVPAHWLKGFMVLPEHRNGPVGFAVLKELLRHIGVSAILTVAPAARRLFTAVGYTDLGTLSNHIALLRPTVVASRIDVTALGATLAPWMARAARLGQRTGLAWIGGAAARGALGVVRTVRRGRSSLVAAGDGGLPTRAAIDDLWARARSSITCGAVRDGGMLTWRYEARRGGWYEAVQVPGSGGTLRALAVVRRPSDTGDARLRGVRVAHLSDLLFDPSDTDGGLAAIAGAERTARAMGADALLCSTNHPAITALLHRRAFVRAGGNVHLLVRDPKRTGGLATALGEWWIMRGDAQSDEGL